MIAFHLFMINNLCLPFAALLQDDKLIDDDGHIHAAHKLGLGRIPASL